MHNESTLGLRRSKVAIACIVLGWLCASSVAALSQPATNFKDYRKSIQKLGLTPLIPASTSFEPGYIYRLQRNIDGNVFQKSVCRQAFTAPPVSSTLSFPDETVAREKGFDLSLKFLPPVLGDKIKAALGVNLNQISNVSISIPKATQLEIAQPVALDPRTGKKVWRTLTADCAEILQSRPRNADGTFRIPIYMVISAVSPETMKFVLNQKSGAKLSLDADAADTIAAGTGMKLSGQTDQSFVLARADKAPRQFVAANIVRLETADPNTEVSSTPTYELGWKPVSDDAPVFATTEPM